MESNSIELATTYAKKKDKSKKISNKTFKAIPKVVEADPFVDTTPKMPENVVKLFGGMQ